MSRIADRFAALKAEGRAGLVTFVTAGDPDFDRSLKILQGLPRAGADVSVLVRGGGWVTAAELADIVGVTPRSIRTYVAALAARVPGGIVVESGPLGYRAGTDAAAALCYN